MKDEIEKQLIEASEELKAMPVPENGQQPKPPKSNYTLDEILELKENDFPKIWEFIPRQTVAVLVGSSDCGKSTLLKQLALAIAKGDEDFLGWKLNAPHKKALIFTTEESPLDVRAVMEAQIGQEQEIEGNIIFEFFDDDFEDRLEKLLEEDKYDVVILDALGDLVRGHESKSEVIRPFMTKIRNLALNKDTSFIIVHHKSKAGNSRVDKLVVKGSQSIESKARVVLDLVQTEGMSFLTLTKGNGYSYDEKQKSWKIEFNPVSRLFKATGDYITRDQLEGMIAPPIGGHQPNEIEVNWGEVFGEKEYMKYGELVREIKAVAGCGVTTAKTLIKEATGCEIEKDNNGRYILI